MSFGDDPFNRFSHFDAHQRLAEFRKRFADFANHHNRANNNMNNMFTDRLYNGWPHKWTHAYNLANNSADDNETNEATNASNDGEEDAIPIKVVHEKSFERPTNEERVEANCDTKSSISSASNASSGHKSSGSSHSNHSTGVFQRSDSPSNKSHAFEAKLHPRVRHIPIMVEPRDGSTSSGYTSDATISGNSANERQTERHTERHTERQSERPVSRSSSVSSQQSGQSGRSGQSGVSHSSTLIRESSPVSAVSSKRSKEQSSSGSECDTHSTPPNARVCQIPVVMESQSAGPSPVCVNEENSSKIKVNGLGQSCAKSDAKPKSGPYVTRIPVVSESSNLCEPQPTVSHESSAHQTSSTKTATKAKAKAKDPLQIINTILTDLKNLEKEVNEFQGTMTDKTFCFLDEMLTRCMIKLDTIETEGKEEIRKKRKEAVLAVNKCINLLEAKVMTDAAEKEANDAHNANNASETCNDEQSEQMECNACESKSGLDSDSAVKCDESRNDSTDKEMQVDVESQQECLDNKETSSQNEGQNKNTVLNTSL